MNISFGAKSLILFGLSVVLLVVLTLFESALAGLSMAAERAISFVLLVLPAVVGVGLGIWGIVRKEAKTWIAWLGILLNSLFALFHFFVLSFAG
ncbi:MAG: hypothetical protein QM730_26545 [Anaerolineales bacterium]